MTTSRTHRLVALGSALTLSAVGATAAPALAHGKDAAKAPSMQREYSVTILNLTDGQPLTPTLAATGTRQLDTFSVGSPVSEGVRQIAENGDTSVLAEQLRRDDRVADVHLGSAPLVPAGRVSATGFSDSTTFTITGDHRSRYFTWVAMLICTNDGFTGLDQQRLPSAVGQTRVYQTNAYDAGSEINTEKFADIVPPCQGLIGETGSPGTGMSNPALTEGGVIHGHPGITGTEDGLSAEVHGWTGPVAQVSITRTS